MLYKLNLVSGVRKVSSCKGRNPATRLFAVLFILGGTYLCASSADAAAIYWDGANTGDVNNIATGANLGGTGSWNGLLSNWWTGSGADTSWVNANNDTAVFWGTVGTVTLTDSAHGNELPD